MWLHSVPRLRVEWISDCIKSYHATLLVRAYNTYVIYVIYVIKKICFYIYIYYRGDAVAHGRDRALDDVGLRRRALGRRERAAAEGLARLASRPLRRRARVEGHQKRLQRYDIYIYVYVCMYVSAHKGSSCVCSVMSVPLR
jgi:hypothetical protein